MTSYSNLDVSAMSDSDVGDQQMLIMVSTNFQNFVDVPFISKCGRYPVHERFPLSSSSSFAFLLAIHNNKGLSRTISRAYLIPFMRQTANLVKIQNLSLQRHSIGLPLPKYMNILPSESQKCKIIAEHWIEAAF